MGNAGVHTVLLILGQVLSSYMCTCVMCSGTLFLCMFGDVCIVWFSTERSVSQAKVPEPLTVSFFDYVAQTVVFPCAVFLYGVNVFGLFR